MVTLALSMVAYVRAFFVPRHKLALEAAALRQQLAVFKRKQTRLRLHRLDREAGNGGFLASGRLSFVLAVAVPATSTRTTEG